MKSWDDLSETQVASVLGALRSSVSSPVEKLATALVLILTEEFQNRSDAFAAKAAKAPPPAPVAKPVAQKAADAPAPGPAKVF